jgi:uncharacterized pyridoxal phosphate-containing UPF0001 family protein
VSRADQAAANLEAVRRRIADACEAAGRSADDVSLVVVTKFFPASDVRLLADLGVTDVGENRHQEAAEKAAECAGLGLRWHFIGALQSNKAAAVASYADVVESVDRAKLVGPLDRGAGERVLDVLLQVSLDPPGAGNRAGADPATLGDLADAVVATDHLRLADVRDVFVAAHPSATVLSAGMSGDLEHAIAHGATHVRVGSAVLGPRPAVK